MNRDAPADTVPQPVDVDVGKQAAAVVEEALPPDRVRTFGLRAELMPSSRRARTALPGKYKPAPVGSNSLACSTTSAVIPR